MYCIHCGKELDGNPKFCHYCGGAQLHQSHGTASSYPGAGEVAPISLSARERQAKWRRVGLSCAVVMLVAVFLCAAVLVGAALMFGMHRTQQTAQILPDSAGALITFNPSPAQLPQLIGLEDKAYGLAPLGALPGITDLVQAIDEELDSDVTFDLLTDIAPWVGWELSVAFLYDEVQLAELDGASSRLAAFQARAYQGPPVILAVATRSEERSDAFLADVREQLERDGVEFDTDRYRGVRITEIVEPDGVPLSYATYNKLVVVATDPDTLRTSIDAALDGRRVLGEREEYRQMISDLPRNRLGTIWLNWPVMADFLGVEEVEEVPLGSLNAIQEIGVAISLEDSGVLYDYLVRYDLDELSETSVTLMESGSSNHELIEYAPAETVLYYSGENLPLSTRSLLEPIADSVEDLYDELAREIDPSLGSDGRMSLSEYLEMEIGVNPEDDILGEIEGEYAIVLASDSQETSPFEVPIGLVILARMDDEEEAVEALGTLMHALESELDFDTVSDEMWGVNVIRVESTGGDALFYYGLEQDVLFVASSEEMVEALADARDSPLSQSVLFRSAVEPLPADGRGYLYVDIESLAELIAETMSASERASFEEEAAEFVRQVRALSLTNRPMSQAGLVQGTIYVYTGAR